jgi:DNA-binding NarL/FixJ family response regulator
MLSKKIKIVIADDHRIFREGLKLMLAGVSSIDILGEAADGAQLIALVASTAPDVIITDPPRAGMHEKLVQQILTMEAPLVVYVSCNPATQARDLQLLAEKYEVTAIRPVDMFPHTHHIENVVQLKLRQDAPGSLNL